MFDGICPNDRILASRFDQAINHLACTSSGAEDTRQRMKTCIAALPRKIFCYQEMRKTSGSCVEVSSQIFWVECSTQWPSAQYFRSIIQPNYQVHLRQNMGTDIEDSADTMCFTSPSLSSPSSSHFTNHASQKDSRFDRNTGPHAI
jgi:hypothetical protein